MKEEKKKEEKRHPKGEKAKKAKKNKDDKEAEEEPVDLCFCFQAGVILEEELKKADYIGTYTVSNSKSAMSKMIGSQIDNKLKNQQELEKKFEDLILQKAAKVNLVEEEAIQELNAQINSCAEELKSSTNSICKTLSENPDIPKNLLKAKWDQKLLTTDLRRFFDDFVKGKLTNYEEVIQNYESRRINIDDLRQDEMRYFRELKALNENLAREEAEYAKDQQEMNQNLLRMKKTLVKTKLEENIFIDYEKNHINALAALHQSNFKEDEKKMKEEIEQKKREREKIVKLNDFVNGYLRKQKEKYEKDKLDWENVKKNKEEENGKEKNSLQQKNDAKRTSIEQLTKKIKNYRIANEHLIDVAKELSYTNFATIHGPDVKLPSIDKVPEQLDPTTKQKLEEQPGGENNAEPKEGEVIAPQPA